MIRELKLKLTAMAEQFEVVKEIKFSDKSVIIPSDRVITFPS